MDTAAISAKKLQLLEGDAFQRAITNLVAKNDLDVQTIPTAPGGDGGLDCLVRGEIGYCCYGIQDVQSQDVKELTDRLVEKFETDLLRLLELERQKGQYVHKPNTALADILAGRKLKHIYLVCNYFAGNKAIGRLERIWKAAKAASPCNHVEATCAIVIEGPDDITGRLTVPSDYHAVLENSLLSKLLIVPPKAATNPPPLTDFEEKFRVLRNKFPGGQVDRLETVTKDQWLKFLSIVEELNASVPREHYRVLRLVAEIREEVSLKFFGVATADAVERISKYADELALRLKDELPIGAADARRLAQQVLAALVGECGIDWR